MTPIKSLAIQKAFQGNWTEAILLNQQLLKENPNDIETLNRIALAFTVIGKIKEAKIAYQKVLALDDQNPIAIKNVKRLTSFNKTDSKQKKEMTPFLTDGVSEMFLEENGKTKIIELVNIAEPKVITHLMAGESVVLHIKRLRIFVLDTDKQYIGMLPDDIGKRLIKFIKGGNEYKACIKAIGNHRVTTFIKEVKRAIRFKNQPSFTSTESSKFTVSKITAKDDQEETDSEAENSSF